MPYIELQVPAEAFLTHEGITVYHTYRRDVAGDRRTFWYALSPEASSEYVGENDGLFDVRELPLEILNAFPGVPQGDPEAMRGAIRKAIERNAIPDVDVRTFRGPL